MVCQEIKMKRRTGVRNTSLAGGIVMKLTARTNKKAPYKSAANTSGVVASIALKSNVKSR